MTNKPSPIVILPGAFGSDEIKTFTADLQATTPFETFGYPSWHHLFAGGFSAEVVIADLAAQIAEWVPQGPIHIVGYSIGGHLGYAAALHLEASGREIAGFCAIDPFMNSRPLTRAWQLLREMRLGELLQLSKLKLRRSVLRVAHGRLPNLTRKINSSGWLPSISTEDADSRDEVSMLLWLRGAAAWIASVDRNPVALEAPTILLRTRLIAGDDRAWRRRCPNIVIHEVPGQHSTLFEPENIGSLRSAFIAAIRTWF